MKTKKMKSIVLTLFMFVLALVVLFPFYTMIMMSTHYSENIYKGLPLLPGGYFMENLKTVFNAHFEIFYKNSLIVSVGATILSLAVSTLCGYALSKYKFKGANFLFKFILVTMMVPTQLGLVAFVVEMKKIGWMNTLLPLIIPPAATGFGVYWMRNYIAGALPDELIESGRIDGAREPGILVKIALPCIKPAIFSLALMNFVTNWNSFLVPLIVLNKTETYTVPIGIINLNSAYRNDLAAKITALVLGTVPLLILFTATSKSFIRGITMGAVKG
ncbi:carbohydrate ABC transporter permease [Ruminiclostridium cellobioparum]|uniref:carbohydrate ABC transporter permease n=1 Tax=Ruminiclostridium cellobioparum TaxID=29355 RepID=UPI0004864001|nr:carbohydrate ABC transporter permease [Ruminiclostridium cellobioparum]